MMYYALKSLLPANAIPLEECVDGGIGAFKTFVKRHGVLGSTLGEDTVAEALRRLGINCTVIQVSGS